MGVISDVSFLGLIGLVIPGVGVAIAMFVLLAHYFFGIIVLAFFWGKSHGWLPKVLLVLAWILPLPLLTVGLILAIIASNKFGAFLVEQAGIQLVALATAGAGEAIEAGAVVAEGAEAAGAAAEGAEAVGATAGGAAAEAGTAGAGEAAGDAAATGEAGAAEAGEDFYENPLENPMGTTEGELLEPSEDQFHEGEGFGEEEKGSEIKEEAGKEDADKKSNASERLKKVFDIADRNNQQQPADKKDNEEDEDERLAA
ncbi:MAG TPA: hypothetical protein VIJ29_04025 [Candidatus Paceibacterota bacterium]